MREKSSECHTNASHVRAMAEMCSRDPAPSVLQHHSSLKTNGKNFTSNPQHQQSHRPQPHSNNIVRCATITESQLLDLEDDSPGQLGNLGNGNSLSMPGGRLKFFKDGKFILELSHRRDGERTTWFPVPKKTFWPPANVTPNRLESSASLSVSDDNSSIQSSPWQRDHCWKQSNPRRNISTEFNFYYWRNPNMRLHVHPRLIARKRRQPFDPSSSLKQLKDLVTNYYKPQEQQISLTVRKSNGGGATSNKSLSIIIDKLARLLDPNVISPRKRILRELERVSLEDLASKRRATPPQPVINILTSETAPVSKQLSSYSITSILGEDKPSMENEPGFLRNLLKPQECQHHQQLSPHQHQQQSMYSRSSRLEPALTTAYLSPSTISSIHQPLYGLPMLPPATYRAPFCWMHYSQPVHYPPPMSLYTAPPQSSPHISSHSPPMHRYKDYREQTLTPPSDMPLNLSKHMG
ncbi:PREDICTED: uncharacterized protein LOC105364651 [Ceratosolen solmsi marchali]|uniref:Uncharacterized protein LOC105364651 n=1 Tax=Ceratosolen solmsi marchali TaxID=326594 RepID=A0AAJ6YMS7_9HYME|nr:PREDICTED: uncharacterized protein LOC105364651 [Ceratosolen solmsi marchali]XP_011500936.1 PREDICTED: uncharacterized protein LOC105364651 [Ceratosolen solmsi marchali]